MQPTHQSPRLLGLDAARGLAVLLMVVVNYDIVLSFGIEQPAWLRAVFDACSGRSASCFVLLAGCGFVLLGGARALCRRALCLAVLGYGWYELWPGDILHHYAWYLLLGAATLRLPAPALFALAAAAIGGFAVLFSQLDYGSDWNWQELEYTTFWTPLGQLRSATFNGLHPLLPWMAFAWCGMGVAKLDLRATATRRGMACAGVAMHTGSWLLSRWLGGELPAPQWLRSDWYRAPAMFYGLEPLPPGPLFVLSATGTALLVVAALLWTADRARGARLLQPLIACGQLALTLYVLHVLLLFFVLQPLTAGLVGGIGKLPTTAVCIGAFDTAALLGATWWRARGRQGPLEALLRRLSGPRPRTGA